MNLFLTSRSGSDGILHLQIPVDAPDTEFDVEIVLRPKSSDPQEAHRDFLRRTAGAWQGEYVEPDPLPVEERDEL